MSKSESLQEQQNAFLSALIDSKGSITAACAAVGVERSTFFTWLHDQQFDQQYRGSLDAVTDFIEEELLKAINSGSNTMALCFYLATKGRDRGYGVDALDLSKVLNVALEEKYREVIEDQGAVIRVAHEYIKKLKAKVAKLENKVKFNATV